MFTSGERAEWEINRRIGAVSAVLWTLYKSALIKRELRVNSKLLIYFLIYVPALTYDLELWVEIERTDASSRNELSLKGWLSLCIKTSQLMWFGHLSRIHVGRFLDQVF